MLLTPAQIKLISFESRWTLCLHACLGAKLFPQSYQYPNPSEGADRVGGQLRGDKECPFSGVIKSGRVWRQVPESDARSVDITMQREREGERPRARIIIHCRPTLPASLFRHLPPNSARFRYATEGAGTLYLRQLSTDAVSALHKGSFRRWYQDCGSSIAPKQAPMA